MNGLNKVFLMGNLGQKPELLQSEGGTPYTNLSIATHYHTRTDDGPERQTDWFWVRVWGKQAENCSRYLDRGQGVMVEGYLNSYKVDREDSSDKPERRIGINAIRVDFLPHRKE